MDKLKTSDKIEQWIKEKLTHRTLKESLSYEVNSDNIFVTVQENKETPALKYMFNRYDHFLKKRGVGNSTRVSSEENQLTSDKSQKRIPNKAELIIDTKRGDTEIRRRPKELIQPYSLISENKHIEVSTSHSNYMHPETIEIESKSKKNGENKLSFETLQNLKSKRSSRRDKLKGHDATYIQKSPNTIREMEFHLPNANLHSNLMNQRINPAHLKSLSTEKHSTANTTTHPYSLIQTKRDNPKYSNIWVEERVNKLNRYRQTEEMKGMLYKQKQEHKEIKRLEEITKNRELEEMKVKMKDYQKDIQKEVEQMRKKRNKEQQIMKESKDLYQLNLINRLQQEQYDNLKETSKYLDEREQQERNLSNKRSSDRKKLDVYYKQNIESNKMLSDEKKKADQHLIKSSQSFLDRLNEKNEKEYHNKLKLMVEKNDKRSKHLK